MRCSIFYPWNMSSTLLQEEDDPRRLSENAHLLRYPHPSSLWRTGVYASLHGISEALYLDIFHQPPEKRVI